MPLLTASRQLSLIPAGGRPPRKQPSPASQVASRHLFLQCSSTNSAEIRSRPSPEMTREFSVEFNEHVYLYIENLLYMHIYKLHLIWVCFACVCLCVPAGFYVHSQTQEMHSDQVLHGGDFLSVADPCSSQVSCIFSEG